MARKTLLAAVHEALVTIVSDVADNPQKLKPGQLCRILNSTPAGDVLSERKLRGHRTRAGLRIGDGKTVDLVRYAAWLAGQVDRSRPTTAAASQAATSAAYETKKERERERNASNSRKGREVLEVLQLGEMPGPADPARKARAQDDFRFFLETYFPARFPLSWSADHERLIDAMQTIVVQGGLQAFAMPRGSGKTTLCECAVMWTMLTGRRKFVALVGASSKHAEEMLESIKGEFEANELLAADWPEVCLPVQALEGIINRCKGQLHAGERTHIQWAKYHIVLPAIAGSLASSATVCVRGITGRLRGMKFRRADGDTVRPDLAIIDDPQTDASAHSPAQCAKRLNIVTGAILGLAGPGKKMAAMMPCTVICKDDMADAVLSRQKHPEWHGELTKLIYAWPTNQALWDEYAELRRASFRHGGHGEEATKFYKKHRKAMDAGARVAWPARFNPDELSALQHAMNLRIDRPHTFDAEFQNAPIDQAAEENALMSADQIAAKVSGLKRRLAPLASTQAVMFVDIQHKLLYWVVAAFSDNFTGTVLDYGTWPDQKRAYFTLRQARNTLQTQFPKANVPAAVVAGLTQLLDEQLGMAWDHESGSPLRISRCLLDSKDGKLTEPIMAFCRSTKHAALVMPSQGKGIGPGDRPMNQYNIKPGDRLGTHWLVTRNKYALRHVTIDTNYWKTFVHDRLATAVGTDGALTLFGQPGTDHRAFSEHLTAETRRKTREEKTGRVVDVWRADKPGRPDNHWFDALVGCAVAASLQGCSLLGRPKPPPDAPAAEQRVNVRPLNL